MNEKSYRKKKTQTEWLKLATNGEEQPPMT